MGNHAHLRACKRLCRRRVCAEAELSVIAAVADCLHGRIGISRIRAVHIEGHGSRQRCVYAATDDCAEICHIDGLSADARRQHVTAIDARLTCGVIVSTVSRYVAAVERLAYVAERKISSNTAHSRERVDVARVVDVRDGHTAALRSCRGVIGGEADYAADAARADICSAVTCRNAEETIHSHVFKLRVSIRNFSHICRSHFARVERCIYGTSADKSARNAARICGDEILDIIVGRSRACIKACRSRNFACIEGLGNQRVVGGAVIQRAQSTYHAAYAVARGNISEIVSARKAKRYAGTDYAAEAHALCVVHYAQFVPVIFNVEFFSKIIPLAGSITYRAYIYGIGYRRCRIIFSNLVERAYNAADVVSARGHISACIYI